MKRIVMLFVMIACIVLMTISVAAETNPCDKQDNMEVPYDGSYCIQPQKWHQEPIDPDDYKGNAKVWIDRLEVEKTDSGNTVTINVNVSGAQDKISSMAFHLYYDTRLTMEKQSGSRYIKTGNALDEFLTVETYIEPGQILYIASASGDYLYDGKMFSLKFKLPYGLSGGEVFPIGIVYRYDGETGDLFINNKQDEAGKLLMTYMFTKGIENGYIKVKGSPTPTTVYFHNNGGSGSMDSVSVSESTYKLPECGFTKSGYTFDGWKCPDGVIRKPGDTITVNGGMVFIYAEWKSGVTPTTIYFHNNGGSGSMDSVSVSESMYKLPECGFTKSGYTFDGWKCPDGVIRKPGETITVNGGIVYIYAEWKAGVSHTTIYFHNNGGSGSMSSVTVSDSTYKLPECEFTKSGYVFDGWKCPDGVIRKPGETITVHADLAFLYAQWKPVDGKKYLNAVAIEIPEPVPGELPSKTIKITSDPANGIKTDYFNDVDWASQYAVSENDTDYKDMTAGEKFEAGKYYANKAAGTMALGILAGAASAPEKLFNMDIVNAVAPDISFTVNGKKVTDGVYRFGKLEYISIEGASIADIPDQVYSGAAITPEPEVKMGDKVLSKGTDYEFSYKDNSAVGTASVTVNGRGKYNGTKTKTFVIREKPAESTIKATIKANRSKVKKGKKTTVKITSNSGGKITIKGKSKNAKNKKYVKISGSKVVFQKKAPKGTYKFTVTSAAKGNYRKTTKTISIKVK